MGITTGVKSNIRFATKAIFERYTLWATLLVFAMPTFIVVAFMLRVLERPVGGITLFNFANPLNAI